MVMGIHSLGFQVFCAFFEDFERKDYSIFYVLARLFISYGFVDATGLCQGWIYGFGERL